MWWEIILIIIGILFVIELVKEIFMLKISEAYWRGRNDGHKKAHSFDTLYEDKYLSEEELREYDIFLNEKGED